MIIVKSPREIELMREAGRIVATVFKVLEPKCVPGVTTLELDAMAENVIRSMGATPSFKGYGGFPGSVCISVNETLIHGIPGHYALKNGDIVSLDVGACYKGYHGDACRTYPVGIISQKASDLVRVTEESFWEAMKVIKPGAYLSDISHAIQVHCESHGYSLPRDYTGHGVGADLHEDPAIPNYGTAGHGPTLKAGMCLAIEPMVNEGRRETRTLNDGWTVKTADGKLASHYENTIVVTETGYDVLTMLKE